MLRSDVERYFGNLSKAAMALGVTKSAAYQWDEIVPERIAYRAEAVSKGALKVDPNLYLSPTRPPNSPTTGNATMTTNSTVNRKPLFAGVAIAALLGVGAVVLNDTQVGEDAAGTIAPAQWRR